MAAVAPELGHAHHHRQYRHGAVGDAGPRAHGGEPVADLLGGNRVHGLIAERGQDVLVHDAGVSLSGLRFPAVGLPVKELRGERGHRVPG